MDIASIKRSVRGRVGKEIFFYDRIGSTNSAAMDLAAKSPEGSVVLADCQERGRGRLGRTWISPPGVNIYMSIILRPLIASEEVTLMTMMSAVACASALRKSAGLHVLIKWPNDLMVGDKKIGGILTEVAVEGKRVTHAVVGIGINVNMDSRQFPDDIRETATSVIHETGTPASRENLTVAVLNEIDRWYRILETGGKQTLLEEWRSMTTTLGKQVVVSVGDQIFSGLAESTDEKGNLIIRLHSGETKKVSSGDVTVLR
ncbi:MAG: biotin--[acetyl-CoA-carboxylase] ligase [Nitrospirota bacterium]